MGKRVHKIKDFNISLKEFLGKLSSKWSVEFSFFFTVVVSAFQLGLVDLWLLKLFMEIALIGFFSAVMIKFGIAVYKDCTKAIIETNKCIKNSKNSPKNKVKKAVKTIENNLPLIEPKKDIPDNINIEKSDNIDISIPKGV